MGFANKHLDKLRKIGRKFVLPSDEIKGILESKINFDELENIVDFGAGTLFWSEYFAEKLLDNATRERERERDDSKLKNSLNSQVIAIDSIYSTFTPKIHRQNIILTTDFFAVLEDISVDLVFMSDVLHHLEQDFQAKLLEQIANVPCVIIKDIDGRHKFGDFMNKTHDLLINGERVQSVYPSALSEFLEQKGYACEYFYLPKLWYPHFLLIAKRRI